MTHKTYADNATVTIPGIIVSQYLVCFGFITVSRTMTILTAAAKYCAIKHVHLEIALREYFRRSNKKYCVSALFHYGITTLNDAIDKMIIFREKDNGAGIDPEILRRLFTKFSSKLETGGTVLDCLFLRPL